MGAVWKCGSGPNVGPRTNTFRCRCRKMDALPSLTIPSQNVKGKLSERKKSCNWSDFGFCSFCQFLLFSEFELQNRASCHRKRVFLKKLTDLQNWCRSVSFAGIEAGFVIIDCEQRAGHVCVIRARCAYILLKADSM